jgi:hypothetical protein
MANELNRGFRSANLEGGSAQVFGRTANRLMDSTFLRFRTRDIGDPGI